MIKFHPAEFIEEELAFRHWEIPYFVSKMQPKSYEVMVLAVQIYLSVRHPGVLLSDEMAEGFSRAFGVSPNLFKNLDKAWRESVQLDTEKS
jgi:plasmid maintenance system antidote protein VapI